MSGCIIPVAPDFQDPLGSPNYAPELFSANPPFGSVTPLTAPVGGGFSFLAIDRNVTDSLFVNWVVDEYMTPSLIQNDQAAPSVNGTLQPHMFSVQVSCYRLPSMTTASIHTLEAIVADGDFVPGTLDKTQESDRKITRGDWFFTLTCSSGATTPP